jgi:hypothetical protein
MPPKPMNHPILPALFLIPALFAACGGDTDDDGSGGSGASGGASASGGSGGAGGAGGATSGAGGSAGAAAGSGGSAGAAQCGSSTVVADGASNYTFSSIITVKPTTVAAHDPEVTFDWAGLTTDFLGRATSPTADIDSVGLIIFGLTIAEFETRLNADDGTLQMFNRGALQFLTGNTATSTAMADFGVYGQPESTYRTSLDVQAAVDDYLDPMETDPASHIFVVMPSTGLELGAKSRMVQVFTIDETSTTTSIEFGASTKLAPGTDGHTGGTDGPSMSVVFDVDLDALTPVTVPAGTSTLTVDWSGMTMNGLGRPWVTRSLNRALIGRYTQSLTELESGFLDLESLADDIYSLEIDTDEPTSLAGATSETGQAFPGIDGSGTWILALFCDPRYCANPAPWYLTILEPCN